MSKITRSPGGRAFTLVELVVVVLILGVLAGVAVPLTLDFSQRASEQAVVTQVQRIFDAAELYKAQNGRWPANAPGGVFPSDLEGMLPPSLFTEPSPIGNPYDWNGHGTAAATVGVSIYLVEPSVAQSIDRLADDGDLSKGWITRPSNNLNFELADK